MTDQLPPRPTYSKRQLKAKLAADIAAFEAKHGPITERPIIKRDANGTGFNGERNQLNIGGRK